MHSLVRAVLSRAPRRDALVHDAELHPPDVQLAQAVDPGRGEGRSVVAADRFRQSDLLEQPSERRLGALRAIRFD
jgi:hypothetical protein